MSGQSRLDRLVQHLTARERALLTVQALLEDRPADPQIRATTPPDQVATVNHYLMLANGILHVLVPVALVLTEQCEAIRMRHLVLLMAFGWGLERTASGRRNEGWSDPSVLFPVAADAVIRRTKELSFDDSSRVMALKQRAELACGWGWLLAIEAVLREICDEFESDVVVPEVLSKMLNSTRAILEEFGRVGEQFFEAIDEPELDEDVAEILRRATRRAE